MPQLLIPITPVAPSALASLRQQYPWLETVQFTGKPGTFALIPDANGGVARVFAGVEEALNIWSLASLPRTLPPLHYALDMPPLDPVVACDLALGWHLGSYTFSRKATHNESAKSRATLQTPAGVDAARLAVLAGGIMRGRDLINQPANECTPQALAAAAATLASAHGAVLTITEGAALADGYPLIHAVGQASAHPPCLIDLRWGDAAHKKITLVGKGVTFDTGGLNIKTGNGMALMKKDMGGAAWVLALAEMIMALKLPICLRVLIPAVENAVGGNAFRPSDILHTRKGVTVEVGDTDAEGRLILADCLWEASQEKPDLLIDAATLTGAQRVALGTDLPAFFTNRRDLAALLNAASAAAHDPLWELPLFHGYRSQLDSKVADICNIGGGGYGGAITAALFLEEFVGAGVPWVHVDFMGWNLKDLPGRPVGGEVQGVRGVLGIIAQTVSQG